MNPTKIASALLIIAAIFAVLILGKSLLIPFVIAVLVWYIIVTLSHWIGEFKLVTIQPFKEWAYAGFFFTFILGLSAHINMMSARLRNQYLHWC